MKRRSAAARPARARSSSTASFQPPDAEVSSSEYASAARSESRIGCRQQRRAPAVQDRLGRRDGHDQVGLDERGMDPERPTTRLADVDEVRALGVVHFDAAMEPARELRGTSSSSSRWAALRARPAPRRAASGREGRAGAVELRHRRRDRGPARVSERSGDGKRRRLDDDRRPPAARDERLERLAGEREAKRVANRSSHVGDRLAGRRRSKHDVVVAASATTSRDP